MSGVETGTHALLPEDLEEPTISSMVPGDCAWTVSWAMWVDAQRKCWLRANYTVHSEPGGTVDMLVIRREDGIYEVDIRNCHRPSWQPRERSGYVGGDDSADIPVAAIRRLS